MEPPAWVKNEYFWRKECHSLVAVCRELIEEKLSVIEGSRFIQRFRLSLKAENDGDFLVFTAIDSETDHLPVGEVRKHWAELSLKEKDLEIEAAEHHFRSSAVIAAQNLINKYEIIE